ncbi:TonB-dependent receptor [Sphingomonas sp. CGMCC 1.13654]|uniref:TonB-dependent receptor n=1 Tax=Sphingomonas chungangi TaxID=2683589 RepID=A0A838LBP3_9SPHN|nr:TonB-dependent receptor [Sphingomonas chungangi]MBA2936280.1 TonB-dependent receptor [Sphingomonas chungangi]
MRNRTLLLAGGSALVAFMQPAYAQAQKSPTAEACKPPVKDQSGEQSAQASTDCAPQAATVDSGAPSGNEIVVTGTRLARAGFTGMQPAAVIGAAEIEKRGYTNLLDALNELPQFGVPGNSSVGAQSGFGAGQSFVDFLGLGSQRTLTLVNGRRFVSSNTASIFGPVDAGSQVDLNNIPEVLVDRVETIATGGAPIYGSDAIAGTVNIILKHNYNGFGIEATNGISQRKDAGDHRISAIFGKNFDDDRGNFVVSGEWNKSDGLRTSDRYLTSSRAPFFDAPNDPSSPYGNVLYQGGQHYLPFTSNGVPFQADFYDPTALGIFDSNGNPLAFNSQGRLAPLNTGTPTGDGISSAGGNGFNIADFGNLQVKSERYLGVAQGSYKVSDGLRFFGEAWYSHSKATNLVDQPYYSTYLFDPTAGTVNGNLLISLDNPFLNPADRATIEANLATFPAGGIDLNGDGNPDIVPTPPGTFALGRANTDWQTGRASTTVELFRFVGGVDGDFNIGGKSWHYEASLNYGHSKARSAAPNLVYQNLINALNSTRDASGNIICAPGYTSAPIATLSSTCAALDPFGQSNTAMQRAAIDYITAIAHSTSLDKQFVGNINAQGSLVTLPGGDVRMSIGYEHRYESTNFDPGAFYYGETLPDGSREGFGNSIPIDPIAGKFHTDEGFAELQIPVVSPQMNLSFLNRLQLEGAARYVKNSLSGGAWTYTLGGEIAPIKDVTFRGNYTRSIRSPAITEVFNPTSQIFQSGDDPCDARYIDGGPDPARRAANCAAAGVPENFSSNYSKFTIPGSVSGNPNLKNETADSYTFGTVVQPRFIPGLTVSADYINISIKNEIVSLSGDDILDACYDAADYPNSFCALAPRDSNGQITFIKEGYYNAAIAKLKAVQAEIAYNADLSRFGLGANAGNINFSFNFYHVINQYTKVGTGDVNHSDGEIGNPKNSFTANLGYANKGFSFLWQTQYFGPSKIDADAAADTYQYPGNKHWYLFNATVGYSISDHYKLQFIVDNVFDKAPPFPAPAGGGTITYFKGILGRYFKVSVSAAF